MKKIINFRLNGKTQRLTVDDERMLLWILRTDLGLTGTKFGCGAQLCGSCTVVVDNVAVRSCHFPIGNVDGTEVITIEGLAENGKLHPLQEAFIEHDAMQCGFCTPGMIMQAYSFLMNNSDPSREDIDNAMEGNLCRCGAHVRIIKAIETAAE